MAAFHRSLELPGISDARTAVLDDLTTMSGRSADECLSRCINWEQLSVAEWERAERRTQRQISEFYRTNQTWAFDLLWYA
jgi:hypothetical protein